MQENIELAEFAREEIHTVVPTLMGKSILACLQKVLDNQEIISTTLAGHTARFGKIENTLANIDANTAAILEKMDKLQEDFSSIKNESRKTTEVLLRLSIKLDKMVDSISEEEFDEFYALAEHIYIYWENLDTLTKKFIPLSEFLFSNLQKYKNPDYSPVIIELCRAIENEFLTKIFAKFTNHIIKKYPGQKLFDFLNRDLSNRYIASKVKIFADGIKRASTSKSNRAGFTLGQMNTIFSLVKESNLITQSLLLKEFDEYLNNETIKEKLLKESFTKQISDLVKDYRNPSAHPEYMSLKKAQECKEFMPDRIEYLMECVRTTN